jgi:UDP-N-acetylglucosamine:LPS N-acetylglucosamine transferase
LETAETYLVENIGNSPVRLLKALPTFMRALIRERPDVIVSTGSEIAIPFFYLAPLLGIKTLFIESWCRVETPSGTARLVYAVANRFFVQWEPLLAKFGSKAEYHGRML